MCSASPITDATDATAIYMEPDFDETTRLYYDSSALSAHPQYWPESAVRRRLPSDARVAAANRRLRRRHLRVHLHHAAWWVMTGGIIVLLVAGDSEPIALVVFSTVVLLVWSGLSLAEWALRRKEVHSHGRIR